MKKYIIIGLGNFGFNLALTLEENGCEVLGVDSSREIVDSAKESITKAVIADAANRETLEALLMGDFDGAVVSIGQEMEASILIALYLKELGQENIIVRVMSDDHAKILKGIGVHETIFPETAVAVRLGKLLASKNAIDYLPLGSEHSIVEVMAPDSFVGKTLRDLEITGKFHCQVLALKVAGDDVTEPFPGDGDVKIPPGADDVITKDTLMVILGKDSDIARLQKEG